MHFFAQFLILCALNKINMEIKVAIFASGSGSNAENIIKYFEDKPAISVKLIITNRADSFVIERAKLLNVDCQIIENREWKEPHKVLKLLNDYEINFIVLAGFLIRVPHHILNKYSNRVINIHPALLPKFGGKGMYGDNVHKAVVEAKETESGITIHYCNEEYDKGDIIFQAKCEVLPEDKAADVAAKVHTLEYKHFPKVIEKLIHNINSKG